MPRRIYESIGGEPQAKMLVLFILRGDALCLGGCFVLCFEGRGPTERKFLRFCLIWWRGGGVFTPRENVMQGRRSSTCFVLFCSLLSRREGRYCVISFFEGMDIFGCIPFTAAACNAALA